MVLVFEYLSSKNGEVMAMVFAEVKVTPKRIIAMKQTSQIKYKVSPGTKNALYFKTPKMFNRATGKPIPLVSIAKGWWLALGELPRLEKELLNGSQTTHPTVPELQGQCLGNSVVE